MPEALEHNRLQVSASAFMVTSLMVVLLVLIALYWGAADLASVGFVTYDSLSYRTQAIEHCAAPLAPFMGTVVERDLIGFNWTTIVSVGAVLCHFDEAMLDESVLLLNIAIMLLTIVFYRRAMDLLRVDRSRVTLFIMLYMLQFYYLAGAVSLNKETFGFLAVAVFTYLMLRGRPWMLVSFALLFGLIKIQYLMLGIYLVFLLFGVKNRYMLIGMSLMLAVIYQFTDMSIFNLDVYYARFDYPISTEAVTRVLNDIVAVPLGYLLALPARFLINIAAGLNPLSIDTGSALSFTYYVSSVLFCLSSLMMIYWILVSRITFDNLLFKFVVAFVAIMGMVPFIQLRYFLPLTPVIILLMLSCRFPQQFVATRAEPSDKAIQGAAKPS